MPEPWVRAAKLGAVALCLLLGVAVGLGGPIALAGSRGVEHPPLDITMLGFMREKVAEARARPRGAKPLVDVLGDSTVISYPRRRSVPERLQQQLDSLVGRRRAPQVQSLAGLGMSFFDQYMLADMLAESPPDLLVINFNLANLSTRWRLDLVRPPLAGALALRRIPEALTLPLQDFGLTADRLLLYVAIVRAGGFEAWRWLSGEQARVSQARVDLERWLGARLSPAPRTGDAPEEVFERRRRADRMQGRMQPGRLRYTARGEREHLGPALSGVEPEHETIQAVDRTLAAYRRAGIEVIFYVNPTNVENLERVGVYDAAGLGRTLAVLREVVERNGADFVDLHELLPDAGFRDAAGHFSTAEVDGPLRVAEALAPVVIRKLGLKPNGRH